jgi:serine/threonine protein phosphatase 1
MSRGEGKPLDRLRSLLDRVRRLLHRPGNIPSTVRPGRPVWAIGDVHGRLDLLRPLADRVLREARGRDGAALVLLGDYVDRGPDSAGVLRFLFELQRTEREVELVILLGNHEAMMLDALRRPSEAGLAWLRFGGIETLASFGIHGIGPEAPDLAAMAPVMADLRAAMPPGLVAWLGALPTGWSAGNVAFAHAGLDPALALADQTDRTRLWGHRDFRRRPRGDGVWVVHGHTIVRRPTVARGRIAIDTGAYRTGRLTAVRIDPDGTMAFDEERA